MLFLLSTLFIHFLHVVTSQRYLVYHREGAYKVPVAVDFDPTNQLAHISAQSRDERLQTLYDFRARTIVYRDLEGGFCFLEPMSTENFSREQRIVQAIHESVLPSSPESLLVHSQTLPAQELTAHWGPSVAHFCNRMSSYMVQKAEYSNHQQPDSHGHRRVRSTNKQLKRKTRSTVSRWRRQLTRQQYDPYGKINGKHGSYGKLKPSVGKHGYQAGQKSSLTPATLQGSPGHRQIGTFSKQKTPTGQQWPYGQQPPSPGHLQPSQGQWDPYSQLLPSPGQQGSFGQRVPQIPGQDGSPISQQVPLQGQGEPLFGQVPLQGQVGPPFGQQVPLPGQGGPQYGQQLPFPGQGGPQFEQQQVPLPGQYGPPFGQQAPLPGQYGTPFGQPGQEGLPYGQQAPSPGEQGLAAGIPPDGGSSSRSTVRFGEEKGTAVAAAHGAFRGGQAQTQVQGGSSRDGNFQAQAQSEFDFGQVESQVRGQQGQATSLATSKVTGVANTRTQTRLDYSGTGEALARGTSPQGLTVAQTQGLGRRGHATSRARGVGMTSSTAQVGVSENATSVRTDDVQEVSASSQGGFLQGNSQSHVRGGDQSTSASARSTFGQDAEQDFTEEDRTSQDSPPSAVVQPDGSIRQTVPQPATPPDGTTSVYQLGPSYFTLVDPRTGVSGVVDPRTGVFSPVDPSTGLPTPIDPRIRQPPEVDPRTGFPIPTDPATGLSPANYPGTGLPTIVDPRTGVRTPVDPRTGVPLTWSQPGHLVPAQDPHQIQQGPFPGQTAPGHFPAGFKSKPKLASGGQHFSPIPQYPQQQHFPQVPTSQLSGPKQKSAFQPPPGHLQQIWQNGQSKPKDPYAFGPPLMHKSSGMDYIQKLKAGLGKSIAQQQYGQQPVPYQPYDQCNFEMGRRCTQGYKMTNTSEMIKRRQEFDEALSG